MTVATQTIVAPERLYALDLVRAGALLLGILFHASLSFYPDFELWMAMDQSRSWPIAWTGFALHSFRMAIFFLLAGYFGHMMFHRRGAAPFIKDRAKRILAPLLVFWIPLLGSYALAIVYSQSVGAMPKLEQPEGLQASAIPLTHLWFLYVLLQFYMVTLILRGAVARLDRGGALRARLDAILAALLRLPLLLPLLLALPVATLLIHWPDWIEWWGIPTPDSAPFTNRVAFLSYGLAFGLGWLIHRLKDGLSPLASVWALNLAVALGLTIAALIIAPAPAMKAQLAGHEKLLFAALYAAMVWFWTFGLIGAALRFITRERPAVRYMADASYWLYIIHLPPLIVLQAFVSRWPVPAELKLVFVFTVAMAIMLASYHVLIRYSFMGAWLNGKKALR